MPQSYDFIHGLRTFHEACIYVTAIAITFAQGQTRHGASKFMDTELLCLVFKEPTMEWHCTFQSAIPPQCLAVTWHLALNVSTTNKYKTSTKNNDFAFEKQTTET
jgi:hypothetical protein